MRVCWPCWGRLGSAATRDCQVSPAGERSSDRFLGSSSHPSHPSRASVCVVCAHMCAHVHMARLGPRSPCFSAVPREQAQCSGRCASALPGVLMSAMWC